MTQGLKPPGRILNQQARRVGSSMLYPPILRRRDPQHLTLAPPACHSGNSRAPFLLHKDTVPNCQPRQGTPLLPPSPPGPQPNTGDIQSWTVWWVVVGRGVCVWFPV